MATNEAVLDTNKALTIIPAGIKRHQDDLNCEDNGCEEIINLRYKHGAWRVVGEKAALWQHNHAFQWIYYHAEVNEKNSTDYYLGYSALGHQVYLFNTSFTVMRLDRKSVV